MIRRRFAPFVLVACVLTLGGCNRKPPPAKNTQPQPTILGPEDIVRATVGDVLTGPTISGELEARDQATMRAQLAGSVTQVNVKAGERVHQGEVLARIRATSEREAVASGQAAVQTAKTALDTAQRDADRTAVLVKAGALAQRDLEQAQSAVESAKAQLAEAQARLSTAREQLRESVVRSPIDGSVSEDAVNTGDVVSAGAVLFTIVNLKTLELRGSIPAENLAQIRPGTPVLFTVQGYPNRTFRGAITRIVPAAEAATKQITVFASIPNDSGILVTGLYAQGRVATGDENAIMVPAEAVESSGNSNYVLEVQDGKVVRQQVNVGARDTRTGRVQITSGLQKGDVVLVGAAMSLRSGAPVEIRNPSASPAGQP